MRSLFAPQRILNASRPEVAVRLLPQLFGPVASLMNQASDRDP